MIHFYEYSIIINKIVTYSKIHAFADNQKDILCFHICCTMSTQSLFDNHIESIIVKAHKRLPRVENEQRSVKKTTFSTN